MKTKFSLIIALLSGVCAYAQLSLASSQNVALNSSNRQEQHAYQSTVDDASEIRKVIETETRAFHEANIPLLRAQWSDKAYIERLQDNFLSTLGTPYLKGESFKAFVESYAKTMKPTGHNVRISDFDTHVSGNMAWATFTDEEMDGSGKTVAKKRQIRVLEREPAGWKIVYLGFLTMN